MSATRDVKSPTTVAILSTFVLPAVSRNVFHGNCISICESNFVFADQLEHAPIMIFPEDGLFYKGTRTKTSLQKDKGQKPSRVQSMSKKTAIAIAPNSREAAQAVTKKSSEKQLS